MTPASRTAPSAPLAALREELGALDAELVALLARRVAVARRIGAAKRAAGLATLDPRREAQVVAAAARHARAAGLPEEAVRDIFWPVVAMCRTAQQDDA
jgi:chorismate mutase